MDLCCNGNITQRFTQTITYLYKNLFGQVSLHWPFLSLYQPFGMTYCSFFFPASYYVAAPLSLASSCLAEAIQYLRYQIAEFIVKGRARMPDLAIDPSHLLKPLLKLGWCQWIGAVIFIWGSLHQIRCHAILVCIHFCHSTSYLFVANANNIQQQLVCIEYAHV